MKLTARIERYARALRAATAPRVDVGLVWTECETSVHRTGAAGELVAVDLYLDGEVDGGTLHGRTVERLTVDAADLGFVYCSSGARIGRILPSHTRGVLHWEPITDVG